MLIRLSFEGDIALFDFKYFIKKFLHATPSIFETGFTKNSACLFNYHMQTHILLLQIDQNIFEGVIALFENLSTFQMELQDEESWKDVETYVFCVKNNI